MPTETFEFDREELDFQEAASIAEGIMENMSPFDIEVTGSSEKRNVTINSSMNTVNISSFGNKIEVVVDATQDIVSRMSSELRDSSGSDRFADAEFEEANQDGPDYSSEPEFDDSVEPMADDSTFGAEGRMSGSSIDAIIDVMSDGTINVTFDDGTEETHKTMIGVFVDDNMQVTEGYFPDGGMNIDDRDAEIIGKRITEFIKENM